MVTGKASMNASGNNTGTNADLLFGGSIDWPAKLRLKITKSGPERQVFISSVVSCTSANGNVTKNRDVNKNLTLNVGKATYTPIPRPKMARNATCQVQINAFTGDQQDFSVQVILQAMPAL